MYHEFKESILVDELAAVEDLAEYVMRVAKDDKRYEEYFAWEQKWEVRRRRGWMDHVCKICTGLDCLPAHNFYCDLEE